MLNMFRLNLVILVLGLLLFGCSGAGDNENTPPTTAASCGMAELLETYDDGSATTPQIGVGADGTAIAVWRQYDRTTALTNIWANRFNGADWVGAELLETSDAGSASTPQIGVDADGTAIVVWHQYDRTTGHFDIWANRFNGADWIGAELLETSDAGDAYAPQIDVDAGGTAIAIWQQYDGTTGLYDIWANRFNGADWVGAELLETSDAGDAYAPQIGVGAGATAVAVWEQQDDTTGRWSIWANRFNGADWAGAELLETNDADDAHKPQIGVAADGTAIAVWQQFYDAIGGWVIWSIWANRFNGTDWVGAELLETNNASDASVPQVGVAADGTAVAVWHQSYGIFGFYNIWTNRFNGTDWVGAELIETNDDGDALKPQIGIGAGGTAVAVWEQQDDTTGRWSIWANRFNGADWAGAELLETNDADDAYHPQIGVDAGGTAIAIWEQYDGTTGLYDIWANRFK